jgi:hypothetical protein
MAGVLGRGSTSRVKQSWWLLPCRRCDDGDRTSIRSALCSGLCSALCSAQVAVCSARVALGHPPRRGFCHLFRYSRLGQPDWGIRTGRTGLGQGPQGQGAAGCVSPVLGHCCDRVAGRGPFSVVVVCAGNACTNEDIPARSVFERPWLPASKGSKNGRARPGKLPLSVLCQLKIVTMATMSRIGNAGPSQRGNQSHAAGSGACRVESPWRILCGGWAAAGMGSPATSPGAATRRDPVPIRPPIRAGERAEQRIRSPGVGPSRGAQPSGRLRGRGSPTGPSGARRGFQQSLRGLLTKTSHPRTEVSGAAEKPLRDWGELVPPPLGGSARRFFRKLFGNLRDTPRQRRCEGRDRCWRQHVTLRSDPVFQHFFSRGSGARQGDTRTAAPPG